jgi:hypothetical protein
MRHFFSMTGVLILTLSSAVPAQPPQEKKEKPKFPVKIDKVRVGFRTYVNDEAGQFKVGMWTPVYVDIIAGAKGVRGKDPASPAYLEFESADSDGVGTYYRIPVAMEPNEVRTFIGYTKPGNYDTAGKIGVTLNWDEKTFRAPPQVQQPLLDLGGHVYLSLGSRIPDLRSALLSLAQMPDMPPQDFNMRETAPRYATFETNPDRLPEHWFGYQGVDLLILNTDKRELLEHLNKDAYRPRLKAIAQWVRRGGRLIIPVNHLTQDLLGPLLQAPVWQPLVPVVPPALPGDVKKDAVARLIGVERFANAQAKPFPGPGENPVPIAKLDPGPVPPGIWEVKAKTEDGRPLITRMPYGRGSITYLAFSLDQPPFTRWNGRVDFLKEMINTLAPRVNVNDRNQNQNFGRFGNDMGGANDITTSLQQTLDNFDVNVVPFGYVALFIVLYILVVGPLDYFILKHVFHKLEWTWITFPAVVLTVSVAAYFTAYALKGNDLKINKIDIVDFDLRTELDAKGERTGRAFAYGQSYFTILSPRIQNYTIGVEPNPAFWGAKAENPLSADQVSWLGRPEFDGMGAMGRSGSQGFFRRPYSYADDAKGLVAVPIPVWTTKSCNASWEAAVPKFPFQADLVYHTPREAVKLSGTLKSHLPVDLEDAWIFFGRNAYPIGNLPGTVTGGEPAKIALDTLKRKEIPTWVNNINELPVARRDTDFRSVQGTYNPTTLIRQAMFFEKNDAQGQARNHSMRFLDFSWRLQDEPRDNDSALFEAILYAHVPFQRGRADALTAAAPLPTHLWLGVLPEAGKTRPALAGTLAQDTYVRVLLPVRPSLR